MHYSRRETLVHAYVADSDRIAHKQLAAVQLCLMINYIPNCVRIREQISSDSITALSADYCVNSLSNLNQAVSLAYRIRSN